jgi:hypothetical protein
MWGNDFPTPPRDSRGGSGLRRRRHLVGGGEATVPVTSDAAKYRWGAGKIIFPASSFRDPQRRVLPGFGVTMA